MRGYGPSLEAFKKLGTIAHNSQIRRKLQQLFLHVFDFDFTPSVEPGKDYFQEIGGPHLLPGAEQQHEGNPVKI